MTNKVKLLTAFFVLSFAMMIGVTPFSIGGAGVLKAEAAENTGDFKVEVLEEKTDENDDYSYTGNVLTISGNGTYEISMAEGVTTTNTDTIKVTSGDDAVIVLNGVNISSNRYAPIEIASGAGKVTIKLKEENTLTATGSAHTGLEISTTKEVTITSDFDDENNRYVGSLTVSGDNETTKDGVAIGNYSGTANINITGGDITAEADGGMFGVGIGSYSGTANITIEEGTVKAYADGNNYGIAIGNYASTAEIDISGGEVTAEANGTEGTTSSYGVAIGSYEGAATITISDGKVEATADGDVHGLAIGSHSRTATITIEGGTVTATAVENYEIKNYQEHTKTIENDSIVFPVTIDTVGNNEAICVLVKTYEHKDAENEKSSIIYYLSKALDGGTAA